MVRVVVYRYELRMFLKDSSKSYLLRIIEIKLFNQQSTVFIFSV